MLESGRISYGQACQDIELTERQRDWLIEKGVAEEWQIVELFRLRQETLRRFQRLARQKHADRTDALSGAASLPAESHPT
jgi:hypothetical protein